MTIASIKKELHKLIEFADEKKLKAIHLLLAEDVSKQAYSDEDLKKFYTTLHQYENGAIKAYPVDTVHKEIRAAITGK